MEGKDWAIGGEVGFVRGKFWAWVKKRRPQKSEERQAEASLRVILYHMVQVCFSEDSGLKETHKLNSSSLSQKENLFVHVNMRFSGWIRKLNDIIRHQPGPPPLSPFPWSRPIQSRLCPRGEKPDCGTQVGILPSSNPHGKNASLPTYSCQSSGIEPL